jgi:hypothetical protein
MRPRQLRRPTPIISTIENSSPLRRRHSPNEVRVMAAKTFNKALSKALAALRRPDAKLVRQHGGTTAGFYVCLPHDSFSVQDEVAPKLLERNDIQPFDLGLPGFGGPHSRRLGNWREWTRGRGMA